jgi:hypothetical protein
LPCPKHGSANRTCRHSRTAASRVTTCGPTKPGLTEQDSATRARFTAEEDELLVELKAVRRMPWREIHRLFSETFPGRSVGTLQVRYCTKLKGK